MSVPTYPKRLIEVDLPISRISTHARDGDRLASDVLTWGKEVNNEANKIL